MLNRRGYSFVMWALIFTMVSMAIVIFFVSVKRGITDKTLRTTDHLLWRIWGDPVQDEGGWNRQQIGEASGQVDHVLANKLLENKGKVRTIINATATSSSSYQSWQ